MLERKIGIHWPTTRLPVLSLEHIPGFPGHSFVNAYMIASQSWARNERAETFEPFEHQPRFQRVSPVGTVVTALEIPRKKHR